MPYFTINVEIVYFLRYVSCLVEAKRVDQCTFVGKRDNFLHFVRITQLFSYHQT